MHNIHKSTHTQARIHSLSLSLSVPLIAALRQRCRLQQRIRQKFRFLFAQHFACAVEKQTQKQLKRKTSEVCVRMFVSMCVHTCACECVFNTCYNSNCHKKTTIQQRRREKRSIFYVLRTHRASQVHVRVCEKQGEHLNERVRCSTRGRGRLFCCFHDAAGSGSDKRCRPLFFLAC